MIEKIKLLESRYSEIEQQLADPSVYGNPEALKKLSLEQKELAPLAEAYRDYVRCEADMNAAEELKSDPEFRADAERETAECREKMGILLDRMKLLLLPADPNDSRSVVMEIRAGAGGEEAALFAASLLRMYTMYAQSKGWKCEIVNTSPTEIGGMKEASVLIEGAGAFSRLKFESGVHRVQRVPETESQGRVQTSTVTVAVLPEAEDVELNIDPKDLQIDTYRSSGAGGQHVNKTESAIRITHLPTGIVVECQDERSQYKNKDRAMKILRSKLLKLETERRDSAIAAERRSQVGSGDRSERIRTYNFPQGRVTDHRIGLTLYKINSVMDGELDEIIDALVTADQAEKLRASEE